eukprot:Clim_evm57s136 gene=Clim_evmTU57s136
MPIIQDVESFEAHDMEVGNAVLRKRLAKAKRLARRLELETTFMKKRLAYFEKHPPKIKPAPLPSVLILARPQTYTAAHSVTVKVPPPPTRAPSRAPARRRTASKDPKAPRRPQNAFILFCNDHREEVLQQLSKTSERPTHEVTGELARRWKDLPAEDKQKYYDQYTADKVKYAADLKSYKKSGGSGSSSSTKKGATARASAALKARKADEVEEDDAEDEDEEEEEDEDEEEDEEEEEEEDEDEEDMEADEDEVEDAEDDEDEEEDED